MHRLIPLESAILLLFHVLSSRVFKFFQEPLIKWETPSTFRGLLSWSLLKVPNKRQFSLGHLPWVKLSAPFSPIKLESASKMAYLNWFIWGCSIKLGPDAELHHLSCWRDLWSKCAYIKQRLSNSAISLEIAIEHLHLQCYFRLLIWVHTQVDLLELLEVSPNDVSDCESFQFVEPLVSGSVLRSKKSTVLWHLSISHWTS